MDRILRAGAVVGLSSVLVVALGAVRYKFIAVELGAPGIGLIGILMAAATFGVTLFSLGLGTSGVQATAAARSDSAKFQRTSSALVNGSSWLGGVGGLIVAVLGLTLGGSYLPESADSLVMVWLGVAVAAMIVSGGFLAMLNGMGRIRALATSNVVGAVVGTAVTVAAVYISGQAGLIAALAAAPVATVACSGWLLLREPRVQPRAPFSEWWPELRILLRFGGVVMLAMLLGSATQLFIRLWVQWSQGLADAGYFQASWSITAMYLGFVLTALAAEYFPRLSTQIDDLSRLNSSVESQIRIALMLGAPVLLWMMVLSPLVLHLLYAPDFQAATGILRWQLFGDIFKIVGWAVGFLLLARKARGAYFIAELSWNAGYLLLAIPLASGGGLTALGIAYAISYAVYALVTLWLAHRETHLLLGRKTIVLLATVLLAGGAVLFGTENGSSVGLYSAIALSSVMTVVSFLLLRRWRRRDSSAATKGGPAP